MTAVVHHHLGSKLFLGIRVWITRAGPRRGLEDVVVYVKFIRDTRIRRNVTLVAKGDEDAPTNPVDKENNTWAVSCSSGSGSGSPGPGRGVVFSSST